MTKIERSKEWETRITAFYSSGQDISAWCEIHNLKVQQLRYWLRKQRTKSQPAAKAAQWLSVEIKDLKSEHEETHLLINVNYIFFEILRRIFISKESCSSSRNVFRAQLAVDIRIMYRYVFGKAYCLS